MQSDFVQLLQTCVRLLPTGIEVIKVKHKSPTCVCKWRGKKIVEFPRALRRGALGRCNVKKCWEQYNWKLYEFRRKFSKQFRDERMNARHWDFNCRTHLASIPEPISIDALIPKKNRELAQNVTVTAVAVNRRGSSASLPSVVRKPGPGLRPRKDRAKASTITPAHPRVITQCEDAGQCFLALAYPFPLQHETYMNLKRGAKRNALKEWSKNVNRCPGVTEGDRLYFGVAEAIVKYVFAKEVEATSMRNKHIAEGVNMRFFGSNYGSRKQEHRELSQAVSRAVGNSIAKINELREKSESVALTEIEALETQNCRLVEKTV